MKNRSKFRKLCAALSLVLSFMLAVPDALPGAVITAQAETATITSMTYDDIPAAQDAMGDVSFGFRMPIFNNGANTWSDVASDLSVKVKVDGVWIDIDSVDSFVYNSNWGHWSDSGFNGYWFRVNKTTYLQLYSKSNPGVTLDYTLTVNTADPSNATDLVPVEGLAVNANRTGTGFIAFPKAVVGGAQYPTSAANLVVYVKGADQPDSAYVNIDNNPASGWIYDSNFGVDPYGYWFTVKDSGSVNVKIAVKNKESVNKVYTVSYTAGVRDNYTLHDFEGTTITANATTGACGVVLPLIGGTDRTNNLPTSVELDNFVYEFYDGTKWVNLADSAASGWHYQGDGYVDYSSKNQWGYFDDHVYGLWFQPVTEDFKLRIGYPISGRKGDDIGSNYIEYQFVGAPNAFRPEDVELGDIILSDVNDPNSLDGWTLYFNEEFDGNSLNMDNWSYNTGYFIDPSEPGTRGWGNNEMEYYTDSESNIQVKDGDLHLIAKYEPYTFTCTDAAQTKVTADYSSGKIISKDKVKFTYGRIDFRAKLPAGEGLWPALWMLPNDDEYGTWAASGELDVMEARGRTPGTVTGTIHYGGTWPDNRHSGLDYEFPEGSTFDDGYHVYSAIWEEDNITWYVDGDFYSYIPKKKWYSTASSSDTAPFDKDFYIIMNLAVGGWFDEDRVPDSSFVSAEMLVDYVRVYKKEGTWEPEEEVAITGLALDQTTMTLEEGKSATLNKIFTPADTTQRGVTWSSSDTNVATVSAGKVTAKAEGTAVITAVSTADSSLKATCTVTVTKKPESGEGGNGGSQSGGDDTGSGTGGDDQPEVPAAEYGHIWNEDKTVTFYVKAKESTPGPLVYYGCNVDNPELSKLIGQNLQADTAKGANFYSFTTTDTYKAGDVISYLYGYVPVNGSGRVDSPLVSVTLAETGEQSGSGDDTGSGTGGDDTGSGDDQPPAEVSKTALDELISICDKVKTGKFTEQTLSGFLEALKHAKEVLADKDAQQSAVDQAKDALENAQGALITKKVTEVFRDVNPSKWYLAAVQYAYDNDLMIGTGDTTFAPDDNVTREQFVQILYNHNGQPKVDIDTLPFEDVKEDWYTKAVVWAKGNGLTSGVSATEFGLGDDVTREQVAKFLYSYSQYRGYSLTYTEGVIERYEDANKVDSWALTAMNWAVSNGVINGKSETILDPRGKATRAECAQMMKNLLEKNSK